MAPVSAARTVPKSLGICYSEAAVSVTSTSITNILSFFAGVITPFTCVRIFCIYTCIAMAFIFYIWQITFFGACLAIDGNREKKNKSFFQMTAVPKPR